MRINNPINLNKMKTTILLFLTIVFFSSCDKSINGTIKDNFNTPVENVTISIKNSAFKTISKNNGSFKLDYVAGQFFVDFQKDYFMPISKELKISEHTEYPMGEITMFRIPKEHGIFFKDKSDYMKIPSVSLVKSKPTKVLNSYWEQTQYGLYLPNDNVFKIPIDSIKDFEFYSNTEYSQRYYDKSFVLVEIEKKLVISALDGQGAIASGNVRYKEIIKNDTIHYSYSIVGYKLKPVLNTKYAFINTSSFHMDSEIDSEVYPFVFVKK